MHVQGIYIYILWFKLTILTLSIETPWSWSSSSNSNTSSKNIICSRAFSFSRSIRSVVSVTCRRSEGFKRDQERSTSSKKREDLKWRADDVVDGPVSACLLLSECLCSLWCTSSHMASGPLWSVQNPFWNYTNIKKCIFLSWFLSLTEEGTTWLWGCEQPRFCHQLL